MQDDPQPDSDDDRVVEEPDDRDEVGHEVEGHREVRDDHTEDDLPPPGHAVVAEQAPEEHDAIGDEAHGGTHRPGIFSAASARPLFSASTDVLRDVFTPAV